MEDTGPQGASDTAGVFIDSFGQRLYLLPLDRRWGTEDQ